jgi:XTP/dITP diphosphohydrolase
MKLLIGTTNPGKLRELQRLLAGLDLELVSLCDFPGAPEIEEDADTYEGNARKKAVTLARWSGLPTLADDSGLEVDALGGAPGVKSARYAGPEHDDAANRRKLLLALQGVAAADRTARFKAVIVVARPEGATIEAAGVCEGRVLTAERGTRGFGYDPLFLYEPDGQTMAELADDRKGTISHRGRAAAVLRQRLGDFLAD